MRTTKNILLSLTYFISLVPKLFYGTKERYWLSLLKARENTTRLDFIALYYTQVISMLILAYCLHFPKGVDKRLTLFILWICVLDFIHLALYAKQGFGVTKVFLAFTIAVVYDFIKNKKNGVK